MITRDNVPARVTAVGYYRIVDPMKSVLEVEDVLAATAQISQTTLRSVLGKAELDALLSERERLNEHLQQIIDDQTEPWGVKVTAVEIKDVEIPDRMQHAIARQAEAERERRAKIINADGEFQAAARLTDAADVIARNPVAIQLRYLQTLMEVSKQPELDDRAARDAARRPSAVGQRGAGSRRRALAGAAARRGRGGARRGASIDSRPREPPTHSWMPGQKNPEPKGVEMFARVSRYHGDAERMRAGFDAVTGELEQVDGFAQAFFLTDAEHSRAMSITLWESADALEASAERAHRMRTQATEPADATIESVESYEVVLTAESAARRV